MNFCFKILVINFLLHISCVNSTQRQICQHFTMTKSNKCKLETYFEKASKLQKCICRGINVKLTWTNSTLQLLENMTRSNDYSTFALQFKNKNPIIIDNKLPIFNQDFFNIFINAKGFIFENVKGFEVNSFTKLLTFNYKTGFNLFVFYDSNFLFFSNGQLINSCKEFPVQTRSFFQNFKSNLRVAFYNNNYKPVCSLAFSNTDIQILIFGRLSKSFL